MIKIENTEVVGWEAAIRGMRNPMNSWKKSDTWFWDYSDVEENEHCHSFNISSATMVNSEQEDCLDIHWLEIQSCPEWTREFEHIETIKDHPYNWKYGCKAFIGPDDHNLMMRLCKAGSTDAKFRRMIICYTDITAPLYMLKELDTYRMGVEKNSCSTMHKIHSKPFTPDDFSHEHLLAIDDIPCDYALMAIDINGDPCYYSPDGQLDLICKALNKYRDKFLETKDKQYWWQMIQLLPSSYNQRRTYMFSYEALSKIYRERHNHKLDEWHTFCDWIESLPYSELITGKENTQ